MSNLKVAKELTIKELKEAFTKEDIKNIFKNKGMYINTVNAKGDSHDGMTIAFNKEDSLFYFSSYVLAYHYFLEMNWI